MVTLREAAQQAIKALERADKINGYPNNAAAIKALRQALEADTKPCACCGEGKARISVTRICDTCGSEYAGREEMDAAKRIEAEQQADPYAYAVYFPDRPAEELVHDLDDLCDELTTREHNIVKLYSTPQPAQQPLTPEQIMDAWREAEGMRYGFFPFARAIERAHGIK